MRAGVEVAGCESAGAGPELAVNGGRDRGEVAEPGLGNASPLNLAPVTAA